MNTSASERAIILAPRGRDAEVAAGMLSEAGIEPCVCPNMDALLEDLREGAGLAIVTDEAVETADLSPLSAWIKDQPEWSDFPFVLLTRRGGGIELNPGASRLLHILGNVTFIERPFHPTTFVSLVEAALRARRRQYEARARLEVLHESEKRLREALDVRRRAEEELKASNDRFRAAIDAVQGILWTSNPDGRMEGEQPGWSALTGQTYEQYRGDGWTAVVHPDDAGPTMQAWRRAVEERRTYVFEHRLRRKDGAWRNYAIRAVPIFDAEHRITEWVGIHTDITAQRAAEAALLKLNATLEERVAAAVAERNEAENQLRHAQKMDAVGQLTGGVAHDFNNLLTPIVGSLDLLRQRLPNEPRTQRTISVALQAAMRATTLVQRLLAFARRQDLQPRPVDVVSLLQGMEELMSRSIGTETMIEVAAPDGLPAAQVDPNQLELAILNLSINARDAMPGGGTIRITAEEQTIVEESRDLKPGRYIRISVKDEGQGMDAETLERAAEPFFSTKGLGKGTGLGLSMVHGLAAQSGGTLRLSSTPGEGTTAEIWLPVTSGAVDRPAPAAAMPNIAHQGGTILLVDDEELVRSGTAEMLQDLGYTVLQAGSGAEALIVLETHRSAIDAMVTDFMMPGMNGASLAHEVRAVAPDLPVLLITGYSNVAEGLGADLPRLTKPFRQAELAAQVAQLVSKDQKTADQQPEPADASA